MHTQSTKPNFPYIATLVAFSAVVIMLILGFWQLDRKAEKEARLAHIESAQGQQSLALQTVLSDPVAYQDFQAHTTGQFANRLFYIDNKLQAGQAGFYVLAPLKTNYGVLMVNLGWVPAKHVRGTLPQISFPYTQTELSSIEGIVYIPTHNRLISETNNEIGHFPVLLQQVDLNEIAKHLSTPVLPFVLRLLPEEGSNFVRQWDIITMAPEKHLAYAVQWFGLAVAGLTIYLLSLLKRMQA